jgi:hypothetical protein
MAKIFDRVLDNSEKISYALYGAIGVFILYRIFKKDKTTEASFSSFAGTANNFFNSTFGGVTKGGGKGLGASNPPTSPVGGGKGGTFLGSLPSGGTKSTIGGGTSSGTSTTGASSGIPSQYQNILNGLLNQYGQVKYKDCYNKFVAYAQSQGITPASFQWYPEMISYMRRCLGNSEGTTAINTETGQVTTGSAPNPYQDELDGLLATYGVTKYRACLSNWMNYAQQNGLTTSSPNYYQTMYVFMQKCLM